MRIEPLVATIARYHLVERDRNLFVTYDYALGCTGLPVDAFPDFIRVTRPGTQTLSFAKPTHVPSDAGAVEYTSGSLTLRVRRG